MLVLVLVVTGWSSRIVRFLTVMLPIIVVASLGPVLYVEGHREGKLPWAPLFHLPLVRNSYPSRLMLFAFLALAVATALFLANPARRLAWLRWPLAVLVLAAIALNVPALRWLGTPPCRPSRAGQYRQQLAPNEIVVVVSDVGNAGMLWQAESGFYMRVAGGFLNAGVSHRTDLPRPVQDLSHARPPGSRRSRPSSGPATSERSCWMRGALRPGRASSRRSGSPAIRRAASWCIR